ncbi:MAG: aminodeoxychorismate lyase [Flavobacteriaceae bacterium]|nr:aminodeoxychorismate lyase [Flavobacteriaceae bacterium]
MSNLKKVVLATVMLGLVVMGGFAYFVYTSVFTENTTFNNEEAHIYIPTGARFSDVLEQIRPLIKDDISFEAVANRKGYPANIKPGHYIIKRGMSNNDIINTIRSTNIPIRVKFNNQERLENLAGHLARQMEPDSLAFLNAFKDSTFLAEVGFSENNALGMYIPNTYEVYWNTSATNFRDRMLKEYNAFWTPERNQKAKNLGLSRDQVIALAAIVQKETAKVDERPRVAGVYLNRLKVGMLLQADPTVIYAKKKTENDFDQIIKRVLYVDLEIDSPYNTYKYAGIPPGPISMPDISAIDAVLHPESHDYYYFVADVKNFGYHKFAKTLSQHNANKAEYVRWISQNGVNR